jgi:hypothetical protein
MPAGVAEDHARVHRDAFDALARLEPRREQREQHEKAHANVGRRHEACIQRGRHRGDEPQEEVMIARPWEYERARPNSSACTKKIGPSSAHSCGFRNVSGRRAKSTSRNAPAVSAIWPGVERHHGGGGREGTWRLLGGEKNTSQCSLFAFLASSCANRLRG